MVTATAPARSTTKTTASHVGGRYTAKTSFLVRACRSSGPTPTDSDREPPGARNSFSQAAITCCDDMLQILIPTWEFDLSHVYVMASSRSIAVEIHTKVAVEHVAAGITEMQDERITREFRLPLIIREGSARVQITGDYLEITCDTTDAPSDRAWSELVRFDTRASLGCV